MWNIRNFTYISNCQITFLYTYFHIFFLFVLLHISLNNGTRNVFSCFFFLDNIYNCLYNISCVCFSQLLSLRSRRWILISFCPIHTSINYTSGSPLCCRIQRSNKQTIKLHFEVPLYLWIYVCFYKLNSLHTVLEAGQYWFR